MAYMMTFLRNYGPELKAPNFITSEVLASFATKTPLFRNSGNLYCKSFLHYIPHIFNDQLEACFFRLWWGVDFRKYSVITNRVNDPPK